MKRTRRLVALILLPLSLYVAVVFASPIVWGSSRSSEIFPFFTWELFARVPRTTGVDYSLRFVSVNGRALKPPVYYEKASAFLPNSNSIDARFLVQSMGVMLARQQDAEAETASKVLEARNFQRLSSAKYQIVRRTYDLLERVDCDCFLSEQVLAEYSYK